MINKKAMEEFWQDTEVGELNEMPVNSELVLNDEHPLLNSESNHYKMFDGIEAIEALEAIMTKTELMAWCRGNVYKYRLRIASKKQGGSIEKGILSDAKKIATYEAYYKYLKERLDG